MQKKFISLFVVLFLLGIPLISYADNDGINFSDPVGQGLLLIRPVSNNIHVYGEWLNVSTTTSYYAQIYIEGNGGGLAYCTNPTSLTSPSTSNSIDEDFDITNYTDIGYVYWLWSTSNSVNGWDNCFSSGVNYGSYVLTSDYYPITIGDMPVSENTTTTIAVYDDDISRTMQLGFYGLILFFISFIVSIWMWKSFMQ